jgi:hypothetical protein
MPTGGDRPRRSPAHAGRLRLGERITIALIFVLAAAVIVVLSLPRGRPHPPGPQASRKAGQAAGRLATGGQWGSAVLDGPDGIRFQDAADRDSRLAVALGPVLRNGTGSLAAGAVDAATGAVAVFGGDRLFHAASIVKADILASLLLEHQQTGTPLNRQQRALAAEMIENSSDKAASDLWEQIGQGVGLSYANQQLGLRQTRPGSGLSWGLTGTTVDDQLRLLADLASSRSPLSAPSRSYELGLMQHLAAAQGWGAAAAAAPGTSPAVKDGWLANGSPATWVINSIGVVSSGGHEILVAVLSSGQPSKSAGITQVDAAARAAVSAISGGPA